MKVWLLVLGLLAPILLGMLVGGFSYYGDKGNWLIAEHAFVLGVLVTMVGIGVSHSISDFINSPKIAELLDHHHKMADAQNLANILKSIDGHRRIPGVRDQQDVIMKEFVDLAKGNVHLKVMCEVYQEDIKNLKTLDTGEVFRATVPIKHDPKAQLNQPDFLLYMGEIEIALSRGVSVERIYVTENKAKLNHADVQQHLQYLVGLAGTGGAVSVKTLAIDEEWASEDERQANKERFLRADYLFFGSSRASKGIEGVNPAVFETFFTSDPSQITALDKEWRVLDRLAKPFPGGTATADEDDITAEEDPST